MTHAATTPPRARWALARMNDVRFQFSIRSLLLTGMFACAAFGIAAKVPSLWLECLMVAVTLVGLLFVFSHERPLAFYLKYVNPLVALLVLGICLFAASVGKNDGQLVYAGFFKDSMLTYFLAKGIFCSTAVFLLGKFVEVALDRNRSE